MKNKINHLRELANKVFSEQTELMRIRQSLDYSNIEGEIRILRDKQESMLPEQTASAEYSELKREIMNQMNLDRDYVVDGVTPKFTEKKAVNQNKVMDVIGGDFGLYQELSTITQKTLKDFAKTQSGMKKPLMNCIEVVSRELSDITITQK